MVASVPALVLVYLVSMSWRREQKGGRNALADEFLRSLFGSRLSPARQNRPTWTCKTCNYQNWMDRKVCRCCPKNQAAKQTVRVPPPGGNSEKKQPALAPWASAEMVQERADYSERAIEAAKQPGVCDSSVESLESELRRQQKKAEAPASIFRKMETTEGFIERAEKRHRAMCDEIELLMTREKAARAELDEAKTRLEAMRTEAAEVLQKAPPAANANETLVDAVRTLMVSMHRFELSEQVTQAAAAVTRALPQESPSEDCLEEVVVETRAQGTTRARPGDADAAMEELDSLHDEDDIALMAIARRLKVARRAAPY